MRRLVFAALVVLFVSTIVPPVEGGTSLAITHAAFDADDGSMTVFGTNFDGFGELEIWIGDVCLSCSTPPGCTSTPSTIECDLNGTPAVSAGGTWKVWVSACNAPHCRDEIHLAIATSAAACNSGDFVECYTGPAGTAGIGECVSGVRSCLGGEWGTCAGETTPMNELCADGLDNDCDGLTDLQDADCCLDTDGDGYGTGPYCLGLDCDDSNPAIPGAPCDGPDSDACVEGVWECVGETAQCTDTTGDSIEICNGIDDDCNGNIDDAPSLCDDGLACTMDSCDSLSGSCVHESTCNGAATFECPPIYPFGDPTFCDSAFYCSSATGQCEADNCCGP